MIDFNPFCRLALYRHQALKLARVILMDVWSGELQLTEFTVQQLPRASCLSPGNIRNRHTCSRSISLWAHVHGHLTVRPLYKARLNRLGWYMMRLIWGHTLHWYHLPLKVPIVHCIQDLYEDFDKEFCVVEFITSQIFQSDGFTSLPVVYNHAI